MPMIEIESALPEGRRRPEEVLGLPTSGPSRRGSTYWRRVLTCPRHHFLSNVVQWDVEWLPDHLTRGLMFHYALEASYKRLHQWQLDRRRQGEGQLSRDFFRGPPDGSMQRASFEVLQHFVGEPGYTVLNEVLPQMVDAYWRRYPNDKFEVVGVEVTLASDFRHGFEYSTRLDLLKIDHATWPVLRICEHKSAARMDATVLEGYTQDLQTLGQVWLVWTEIDLDQYPPFVGSWANVVSTHKETQLERVPVQPKVAALENWAASMRTWQALLPFWASLNYPQNFASCVDRYGFCPFFDVCRLNPELGPQDFLVTDDALPGYFRRDKRQLPVVP